MADDPALDDLDAVYRRPELVSDLEARLAEMEATVAQLRGRTQHLDKMKD